MNGKYDDIIDLPHPEPRTHPRMSLHDRAAQFAPYAALTGHSAAIVEAGRLTGRRIELDEYEITRLDEGLQQLQEMLDRQPTVSVTYFQPDKKKEGGAYQTVTGVVKRIDSIGGTLLFMDGREIPIGAIIDIDLSQGGSG